MLDHYLYIAREVPKILTELGIPEVDDFRIRVRGRLPSDNFDGRFRNGYITLVADVSLARFHDTLRHELYHLWEWVTRREGPERYAGEFAAGGCPFPLTFWKRWRVHHARRLFRRR